MRNAVFLAVFLFVVPAARADITTEQNTASNRSAGFETTIDDATKKQALQIFMSRGIDSTRDYLAKQLLGNSDLPHHDLLISDWLIQSGRLNDAIPILEQLASKSPPRKDIHYTFAWIALGQGRVFDAATHVEHIQKLPFESKWSEDYRKQFTTSVRELQANIAERRGEWKTAFELYSTLVEAKPGSLGIKRGLARSAFHVNNLELAQSNLRLLEQVQQPTLLAESVIAKWFEEAGNPTAAEEWFRKSLDRGDLESAAMEFGMWLLRTGRPGEINKLIERIPEESRSRPQFLLLNAQADQMKGEFSKTIPTLRRLVDEDENDRPAMLHLAWALSDSDNEADRRDAIGVAESLVKQINAPNLLATATLSWAQYRAGDEETAMETIRSLPSNNLSRDVAFFIANIHQSRGNKEFADSLLSAVAKSKGEFFHQCRMPK